MKKTIQTRSIEERAVFFKKNTGKFIFNETATKEIQNLHSGAIEIEEINNSEINDEEFPEAVYEEQIIEDFQISENLEENENLSTDSEDEE